MRDLDDHPQTPPSTCRQPRAIRLDRANPSVKMKLNISYPANGSQKLIEVEDERKLRVFMEKRMGTEVSIPFLTFHIRSYNKYLGETQMQHHGDQTI